MNASWTPKESPSDLWLEKSLFAGQHIASMGFGAHTLVFFTTIYYILKQQNGKKTRWFVYVTAIFVSSLVYVVCSIYQEEIVYINQRDYPGGPFAWITQREGGTANIVGQSGGIICLALTDALLLCRCFAVWGHQWSVIVFPFLMYLASLVMGSLFTAQLAQPDQGWWGHSIQKFSRPYFLIVLSFNIITSALLVARLLYVRRLIIRVIGLEHARVYTTAATIVIESALPLGLYCLVLAVIYSIQNYAENLLIVALVQLEAMASETIILRVVRGRAWTRTTTSEIISESVAFRHATTEQISGNDPGMLLDFQAGDSQEKPSSTVLRKLSNASEEPVWLTNPAPAVHRQDASGSRVTEGGRGSHTSSVVLPIAVDLGGTPTFEYALQALSFGEGASSTSEGTQSPDTFSEPPFVLQRAGTTEHV